MYYRVKYVVSLVFIGITYFGLCDATAHHGGKVHISPFLKLYIKIIDNSIVGSDDSFGSELSELDRFQFMRESIIETFRSGEYPLTLKFVRFGKDIPLDVNVLTITISRWFLNRLGEYETRIFVKLKSGKEEITLGYFVGRYIAVNIPGRDKIIKNYKISAKRALTKLLPNLQLRTASQEI